MKYDNIENKLNRLISFAESINNSQIIPDTVISKKVITGFNVEYMAQSDKNERKFYDDLHARRLRLGASVLRNGKFVIDHKVLT